MQEVHRTPQAVGPARVEYVIPHVMLDLLKDLAHSGTDLAPSVRLRLVEVCGVSPGPCWCGQHAQVGGYKVKTVEVRPCSKCGVLTVASDLLNGVCPTCYPTPARQAPAQESNGQTGPILPTSPEAAGGSPL
jgi:hypothetical protein